MAAGMKVIKRESVMLLHCNHSHLIITAYVFVLTVFMQTVGYHYIRQTKSRIHVIVLLMCL